MRNLFAKFFKEKHHYKDYDSKQYDVYFKVKDLVEPLNVSLRKLYYDIQNGKLITYQRSSTNLITIDDAYRYLRLEGKFNEYYIQRLTKKYRDLLEKNHRQNSVKFYFKLNNK